MLRGSVNSEIVSNHKKSNNNHKLQSVDDITVSVLLRSVCDISVLRYYINIMDDCLNNPT